MQAALLLCAALLCAPLAEAARTRQLRTSDVADNVGVAVHVSNGVSTGAVVGATVGATDGHQEGAGKVSLQATIKSMIWSYLSGKGPSIKEIVNTARDKMDISDAVRQLDGKLPADVASLVRLTSAKKDALDEASMQKARGILNDLIYQGWLKVDNILIEAAEFQERNRGTYDQVVADLARLGSQLAKYQEERVTAGAGEVETDKQSKDTKDLMGKETSEFESERITDSEEMTLRRNDLAVFDFVLKLTACPSGGLLQLPAQQSQVRICNASTGPELRFDDPKLQAQVEKKMTPEARLALRRALGQVEVQALLQQDPPKTPVVEADPVQEGPHPEGQWKKCVDGKQNCGLLHDLMSLEWGKFRDSFDELSGEMKHNQAAYDKLMINLNDQLTALNDAKTRHMEALASATSNIDTDTEESNTKEDQKRDLTEEFETKMKEIHDKLSEVLYTEICAIRKVRNELLVNSVQTPPASIVDCDFSDWASKTGQCIAPSGAVILCDDTCDTTTIPFDPFVCGGHETLKREIVVAPNDFGMRCPPLERPKRCGQKKCPVNCEVSEWSGWSKCTKECEGGVQVKTRSILTKPKNGGTVCDASQEERNCNTGSCDRNCVRQDWSDWAPCSMACGGGLTHHTRSILIPIRGQGKCPAKDSVDRFMQQPCNTQACIGDEICIAHQDLIIALDASGSLKEEGFNALRAFTANFTDRYRSMYFGKDAVRMGVVVFGNGHLIEQPDGSNTISAALGVQAVTDDLLQVRNNILATTWQRGFTNMAQALQLADVLLSQGGRKTAQSSVLVLSDGKFSFKHQTAEKAQELKDKNVLIYMAPVTDFASSDLDLLKQWASQPWETNYEHIPGIHALEYNAGIFVQKLLAKFCPDSISPSQLHQLESDRQFILIHEDGTPGSLCAAETFIGDIGNVEECAGRARELGHLGFAYGTGFAQGRCYAYALQVTEALYAEWQLNREKITCSASGPFLENPGYETYAINPSTVVAPGAPISPAVEPSTPVVDPAATAAALTTGGVALPPVPQTAGTPPADVSTPPADVGVGVVR